MVHGASQKLIKDSPVPMSQNIRVEAPSDEAGIAILKFKSIPTPGGVAIHKQNHYSSFYSVDWKSTEKFEGKLQNAEIKAVLKPVMNPIPMHAHELGNTRVVVPDFGVEYGYDLQMCQFTSPHGSGRQADIVFKATGTNDGLGKGSILLTIKGRSNQDGFVEFLTVDRERGSIFLSDYKAPENGYVNCVTFAFDSDNMTAAMNQSKNGNYYFRSRVNQDADGKIKSCHFGKIYGPFTLWGIPTSRGGVASFGFAACYFNPTSNDRNVEFDPKCNLNLDGNVRQP
jgi:uncharacterized protein (DUF2141 family)